MSSMKLNPRKFRQCMKIELVGVENQTQISSTYKQLWEDWKLFKNSRMFWQFVCLFVSFFLSHESRHALHGCESLGSFGITKPRQKAASKTTVPKTDDECVWWEL